MEPPVVDDALRLTRRVFQFNRVLHLALDEPLAQRTGLSVQALFVLRAVWLGFDRPGAIARRLAMAPPSVSRALAALEQRRLIERRESSSDRRQSVVSLTDDAASVLEPAEKTVVAEFQRSFPQLRLEDVARVVAVLDDLWLELGIDDGYPEDRARAAARRSSR